MNLEQLFIFYLNLFLIGVVDFLSQMDIPEMLDCPKLPVIIIEC